MSDGSNPSSPARDLRGSRHKDTLAGHAARDPVRFSGMVNPPVFRGSTVLFEDTATYEGRDPDDYKVMRYGVHGTPTTFAFEAAVAELEGGHAAVAVPSGLAAITAALFAHRTPERSSVATPRPGRAVLAVPGSKALAPSAAATRRRS